MELWAEIGRFRYLWNSWFPNEILIHAPSAPGASVQERERERERARERERERERERKRERERVKRIPGGCSVPVHPLTHKPTRPSNPHPYPPIPPLLYPCARASMRGASVRVCAVCAAREKERESERERERVSALRVFARHARRETEIR